MEKKRLGMLIIIIILTVSGISLFAFNSGKSPETLGHSGEEIEVYFRGETKTINTALNELYIDAVALENKI